MYILLTIKKGEMYCLCFISACVMFPVFMIIKFVFISFANNEMLTTSKAHLDPPYEIRFTAASSIINFDCRLLTRSCVV